MDNVIKNFPNADFFEIVFEIERTRIAPTIAIITNSIFTDFKYLLISGFFSPFENNPAPKDITK